jgi:hypothetical protein
VPNDKTEISSSRIKESADQLQEAEKLSDQIRRSEKWIIWLTAAIFFASSASAVIFWLQRSIMSDQLTVMSGQLDEMRSSSKQTDKIIETSRNLATAAISQVKQLEASVRAAQDNAKSSAQIAENAKRSIAVAEKQARISLRAWVVPTTVEFTQFEVGKVITIKVESKNTGRTPAINATINGQAEWFMEGPSRPPIKPFPVEPEPLGKTTIRSDGGISLTLDLFVLTDETLGQIHSGQRINRVHGKSWYDDVFNHHHWMTFCREYEEFSKGFVTCDVEGQEIDGDPE